MEGSGIRSAVVGPAWQKSRPRFTGTFARDAAAAKKFWRAGAAILAKLPKKSARTPDQQMAAALVLADCRRAREEFLKRHAETVYRRLTKSYANFLRVDELVYEAAKLVPGLTPT